MRAGSERFLTHGATPGVYALVWHLDGVQLALFAINGVLALIHEWPQKLRLGRAPEHERVVYRLQALTSGAVQLCEKKR